MQSADDLSPLEARGLEVAEQSWRTSADRRLSSCAITLSAGVTEDRSHGRFAGVSAGNQRDVDVDLADQALRLAGDKFEERVDALIAKAHGDRSQLAMAAARLSSLGPTSGDSKEQIAFALLLEAAHRVAAAEEPYLKLVDEARGS